MRIIDQGNSAQTLSQHPFATTRSRLRIGTAVAGILAFTALFPSAAWADEECGPAASGTVTCTAAGNPYPDGVTYVVPPVDLTINLNPDVVINTSGGLNIGVFSLAVGSEAVTLNGAPGSSITTDADGAFGVLIATNYGAISSTTDIVTTSGTSAGGVFASSYTGDITITGGTTTTTGDGADGLYANNNRGNIQVTTGIVSTSGTGAGGATARSDVGNVRVDVGTITTTGSGAVGATALTGFTGSARIAGGSIATGGINSFGAVATAREGGTVVDLTRVATTGTGADAIRATSTGGTTVVRANTITTTGDNARGIVATGTTGTTIRVGSLSTTGAGATGILVPAGVLFFGPPATATASITTTGAISTTGTGADAISASVTGDLTLTNGGTITATGAGSQGIFASSGTGTTIVNSGAVSGADYAIRVDGAAATVTNSGTVTGRVRFNTGDDSFANSGNFNLTGDSDFGAGTDGFTNSGTIRSQLAAAGTVSFLNLETLNNSGLIELRNARTGDVFATSGNYVGSGAGALGLDVNLTGAIGTADRLTVGGTTTGSTQVNLALLGSGPVQLNAGTLIVQAGAASSGTAFTLDSGVVDQGLVQLGITYNPTTFAYSLVATPGVGVFRAGLFVDSMRNMWLQSADAWSGHMRGLRDNVAANGAGASGGRFWAQAFGQKDERSTSRTVTTFGTTSTFDLGYEQDYFGGQFGVDFGGPAGDGAFAFGLTGGYLNSSLNFAGSADRIKYDAVNAGAYVGYTSGIFFANVLGKYDYYWGDNRSVSGRYTSDLNGSTYGAKAEFGARIGTTFFVEPSASIAYTKTDIDDFGLAQGNFAFDADEGLRGKAGARVGYTFAMAGSKAQLYAGGNYVHEFQGRDRVTFTSGGQTIAFAGDRIGDYGEATVGLNVGSDAGKISGFFEGRYANGGDSEGYGGRAGMRFRF